MSITALDKTTVKKLTTAQIVTSVFSAVKELVENALDAGASNIDINLEEQGLSLIEVRDNAKGICETDSSCIALPSYTSKLSNFNDLESLETYGFRGEALSALCRVSDVKIITRTEREDAARYYLMNHDGNIVRRELCARSIGTTVQVSSLLKKIPVRRKIISSKKRAKEDVEAIEFLLQDFGVCHPNIRINYRVDNINRFVKLPTETIKESLIHIFNRKLILNYEFLSFNDCDVNIELIIPKSDLMDVSSVCQKVYSRIHINNRPVSYKEFEKLIITLLSKHFGGKMPGKKKPIFFLIIKVPPSDIDVNLEPNKTKVLLKNFSSILTVVEKLLSDYYEISESDEIVQADISTTMDESLVGFMDDTESDEEDINVKLPSCKKRKIENNIAGSTVNKAKAKVNTENKENEKKPINYANVPALEEETLSQLPKVDLGPDFSTQDIADIPVLDAKHVQHVMDKLEQAGAEPKTSNIPKYPDTPIQLTESQWSKGHCKNLKGGTNIEVVRPSSVSTKKKNEINDSNRNPATRGFLKFSEKMGQQLKETNPGVDFVTIATSIATKWKQLTGEEREHYRELGRQSILADPKLNVSGGKKRLSKITPEDVENNKKRMRNMIEKMGDLNTTVDDCTTKIFEGNVEHSNKKIKSVRHWQVKREQICESHLDNCYHKENYSVIIGPVDDNIWTVNTNSQIWALNLNALFDALNLDEQKRKEAKGKWQLVETYFKRGLDETNNMNFMHPIHSE